MSDAGDRRPAPAPETLLGRILAGTAAEFTDVEVAPVLCDAVVAELGGRCELYRRDWHAVMRCLGRAPSAGGEPPQPAVLPEGLAALLARPHATGRPVPLSGPPWRGPAAAVPVNGVGGSRWVLLLEEAAALEAPDGPQRLGRVAEAATHVLALGGARSEAIAARHSADAATHRLVAVSRLAELLPASLELPPTIEAVLDALVPYVGDWAQLFLAAAGGRLARAGYRHVDEASARLLADLESFPLPAEGPDRAAWLARTEPFRVENDAAGWGTGEQQALVQQLAPLSAVVAPMWRGKDLVGLVVVGTSTSGQMYGRDELRLVRDLAKQARLAVQAAQLFAGAERARQEREEVLAIVSHDLRSPLQLVRLAGATLASPDLDDERRRHQAASLQRGVAAMDRLIRDLLDAARLDAGSFSIESAPLSPVALVAETLHAHELLAAEKGVALAVEAEAPETPVLADREAMRRVFGNLVGNAIAFTPTGGRVTLGAALQGPFVAFRVRDSGPGIAPQALPRIFDRFWQANRSTRTGAGLGLAIAKGIVEAHGGSIAARSLPEGGSEFTFTLRRAAADETAERPANGRGCDRLSTSPQEGS